VIEVVVTLFNFLEDIISLVTVEWEVSTHEHVQQASNGPHVDFGVVFLFFQNFRCHVVWSPRNRLQLLCFFHLLFSETEVD
jgi:hypothetical protein